MTTSNDEERPDRLPLRDGEAEPGSLWPPEDEPGPDDTESEERGIWRYEHCTRARLVIDAADYFLLIQEAMMKARRRIMLIGWDFDTRIALGRGRGWLNIFKRHHPPRRLGAFIVWLTKRNPDLKIRVLKWNFAAIKMFFRGSMILDMWRWFKNRRITFKFDAAHPMGCSHHQKIVVIDDRFAVCGGIDMTADRWDTSEHSETDRLRRAPGGRRYMPWHDLTMLVEGEVAGALDELGRNRWRIAGGEDIGALPHQPDSPWPEGLEPQFTDIEIGIARTRAEWKDNDGIFEIETLFLDMIRKAKRFIYAENQYFASRKIAEVIAERMAEPDPPEIVLLNPLFADGWLEQEAMDTARARLVETIARVDHKKRFRIYNPLTEGGSPIYVHAKLTIVDDMMLKVGSANMNNRSLGLDSECDLFIDANRPANAGCDVQIRQIRHSLLAEHIGVEPEEIEGLLERYGSMHEMIAQHPQPRRRLQVLPPREMNDLEKRMADEEWLDPEDPGDFFEPIVGSKSKRAALFRKLRAPG